MDYRTKFLSVAAAGAVFVASTGFAQDRETSREAIWLQAHNTERAQFGAPALEWNNELANEAQGWADQLAREGRMRHAPINARKGRGENLWMGTRGHFAPHQMIDSFLSEKQYFRAGTFPQVSRTGNWADVGHYTQIVWRDTREVGCAISQGRHWDVLVCRYWPAGNVIGTRIAPQMQLSRR